MIRYTIFSSLFPVMLATTAFSQGVGINLNGAAPNNSSILDISSTSQGVLVPRVALTSTTDATTITNGNVLSLLVFNTATIADVTPGYYYWNGTTWQTLGGDADADPSNEIQDLQLSGNNLTITNNGTPTTIDLSSYLDNTDTQDIDSVSLNGTNLTVYIQNGAAATVDLSTLSDHDWYEVGGVTAPDNINDDLFTHGNVGIGATTPDSKLTVYNTYAGQNIDTNIHSIYLPQSSLGITHFLATGASTLNASNNIGLHVDFTSTNGTNEYGLFIDGEHHNYFSGIVGIQESSPTNMLSIGANLGTGYGLTVNSGTPYGQVIETAESPATSNPAFWVRTNDGGTLDHLLRVQNNGNVGIGTVAPAYKTHISGTGPTELMIEGTATGYINAGIALKANTSTNYRGTGVFMYDLGGQNEWYAGRPYNSNDTYVIQRNTNLTNHNTVTAALVDGSGNPTTTERFFSIDNEGDALVSGSNPDASAKLEVRSSNKGFLPPRVALTGNNDVTTITTPASGLLVYNTASAGTGVQTIEPGYYYFNGTIWKAIGENSDWYMDNSNSFMGNLPLPAGTATSLYTAYVNLQKGVYFVNFYDCLGGASQNYYVQTTAESSSPANFASGFMNYNYNARTDFSHAGFVIYVRQDGTPVRFRVHNPAGGTLTHTSGNCSAFYYYKISE
ncbi:MAG: hypothetical protein N4A35_10580 [Flavobacteriales bacterium]|jgi:hypothetical protein|nr:hypothetical protein [Flavobacteriales bacterium]